MKKKNKISGILLLITMISLTAFPACRIDYSDQDLDVIKEKTFNIEPGKELRLKASSGDVFVTTWDKPEVYVKIYGNERAERKVEFTFNSTEEYVEIITEDDNNFSFFGNNIRLRYEITVPKYFNNNIRTSGGDVHLTDITGAQLIKTSGGDIRANAINGDLKAGTSGGDIYLKNSNCSSDFQTSGGDIDAREFIGDISCSTSGGDITLFGKESKIYAHTSGGSIRINYTGVNKGMDLSTSGGDITLHVPQDINASINFRTSGGDISNNIKTSSIVELSDHKMIADLNSGGKSITAVTSGGDIRIE